jgi:hypothetical protein
MEMERKKDASEFRQVIVPEGDQRAFQLAQLAFQLRGDSKEPPETFLDDALSLLNAAQDRIEPKRDPIDVAYDEFSRTGTKDDLARFLQLREESLQVPTALLFFSGSSAKKAKSESVNRIGLAASGAVIWSPKKDRNYSPAFREWQPMEIGNFFYKGLLERCHEAFI